MLEGVVREVREVPANLRDILITPKSLAIVIVGLCFLLYSATDPKTYIFAIPIFSFGFIGYFLYIDRKAGYKLGAIRTAGILLISSSLIGGSFYGYSYQYVNDIHVASIPQDIQSKNQWTRDSSQDFADSFYYGLARLEIRGYMYNDQNAAAPPYPGEMWLATLKTLFLPTQQQIEQQVTKKVEELKINGLTINKESKRSGSETLYNGHIANFVEYEATLLVQGTGILTSFATGAKIRVRAEWYSCAEKGTAVIAIGAAQWGTTSQGGRLGQLYLGVQPDDTRTYDGLTRLIYRVNC